MRSISRLVPLICLLLLTASLSATQITIQDPPVSVSPITNQDIPFQVTFGTCDGLPEAGSYRGCFAFFNDTSSAWSALTLTLTMGTPSQNTFRCSSDIFAAASCSYDVTTGAGVLTFTRGMLPNNDPLQAFVIAEDDLDPSSISFSANPTFVTTAATPEPSGLILLGTGMLGVASMLRARRRVRA